MHIWALVVQAANRDTSWEDRLDLARHGRNTQRGAAIACRPFHRVGKRWWTTTGWTRLLVKPVSVLRFRIVANSRDSGSRVQTGVITSARSHQYLTGDGTRVFITAGLNACVGIGEDRIREGWWHLAKAAQRCRGMNC